MKLRPSQEQLRRHFRYNPVSGRLYFRDRHDNDFQAGKYPAERIAAMWRSKFLGKEFGSVDDKGYRRGWYEGRFYRAHQIIWAMHHDEWPPQIDHKNGNRQNNQIDNLRAASNKINSQNRALRKDNKSGVPGVMSTPRGRWRVQIGNHRDGNGYVGTFDTFKQALAARRAAERTLNYHPNHGRRVR
jgi:hypothetical protein